MRSLPASWTWANRQMLRRRIGLSLDRCRSSNLYFTDGRPRQFRGVYTIEMTKYSIVVPFHNEEENVTALYDRLKAIMETVGDSFELVLVDDGSSDRTYRL